MTNNFDILILTAANEAQADGYRAQLAWRRANGLIHPDTETRVITDPGGRRVGSLGATLNVLAQVAGGRGVEAFAGRRILICHSGGDSRRTPAYAAQGKVFTPVPATGPAGQPLALFDLILRTVSALPAPAGGHVLITSGDVLLTFDHASVDFSRLGVTGVAYFGPVERGSRHGVYVPSGFGANPQRTECVPVVDFLQKPSETEARACGAVDPFGHVAVDTGLISLTPEVCARLVKAAGVPSAVPVVSAVPVDGENVEGRRGENAQRSMLNAQRSMGGEKGLLDAITGGDCPPLDLYEELTMAVAPRFDEARYLDRFVTVRGRDAAHRRRMRAFYRALRGVPFQVNIVPYCEFFHIGSSRELLAGFSGLSRTAQAYGFANGSGACVTGSGETGRAFVFNARIECPFTTGNALVESVHAAACAGLELAGENILTGLPPEATAAVRLPSGTGLVVLPVGARGWAAVAYGLDDDFKTPFGGSAPCRFLNVPIERVLARAGMNPGRVWRGDERDGLWRARLWRVGQLDDVLAEAMTLARLAAESASETPSRIAGRGTRYGLAELLPRVNHARLLAVRAEIRRQVNLLNVAARVLNNDSLPAAEVCGEIRTGEEATRALRQLAGLLDGAAQGKPLLRARILRLMAMIGETLAGQITEPALPSCLSEVAAAVAVSFEPCRLPRRAAILHDQVVWVTTPVRIDFAGGWSDTPPICTERGGTVLNAAVTLNGLYPVQVMAKLNTAGCIRLSSIDLGERKEIRTTAELLDHHDPHDWAALAKAALILAGIGPSRREEPLAKWLKTLGGGLDLTIFSSLPKGSGMGTSSILGAAVIACLDRVLGVPFNTDRLIRMTSILEQRMCTGGGWQDQVGGIMPGVKLIRTQPGPDQTVSLRWTVFDMSEGSELKQRCLLYFTGQKRMARNILQNVVSGYLARDPAILRTVEALKVSALATKEALDAQDIDGFAAGVARYWELKKSIDPGSTNAPIEALLASVSRETLAALLPGAGGGGFIFMIAKSAAAAERIRASFEAHPPNAHARFFDFDVDRQGLKVTVL
ncbi:MAG TPA: L-fucokinase [Kiritimatiellia bacterium]|nr:L-fucokinase [Kiritimatiellia bacterium]